MSIHQGSIFMFPGAAVIYTLFTGPLTRSMRSQISLILPYVSKPIHRPLCDCSRAFCTANDDQCVVPWVSGRCPVSDYIYFSYRWALRSATPRSVHQSIASLVFVFFFVTAICGMFYRFLRNVLGMDKQDVQWLLKVSCFVTCMVR